MDRRTFVKIGAASGAGAYIAYKVSLGNLQTVEAATPGAALVEDRVASACWIGKQDCGLLVRRVDGRVVKIEGHPDHPRNRGKLCPKGVTQIHTLYDPTRVRTPLVRKNAKGVPGEFRTATWDEALTLVADKLSAAVAKDKRLAVCVEGRAGKVAPIYNDAFPKAAGMGYVYGRRGNDCGGASEDATLTTWGVRTGIIPDLKSTNYLICYWNLTQAGGPGLCNVTYPQQVLEAKARGMKVVSIDPYNRPVAHFADEWVPIKPGTDMAFWLAILHELIANSHVDRSFLASRTNAASLVKDDGSLWTRKATITKDGKDTQVDLDLVWDANTSSALPYGAGVVPSLEGSFEDDTGARVRPAFEVLKEHVAGLTVEWAAAITDVPAAQIARVARELGENAMIGSTTVVDGVTLPLRPVAYGIHATATKFHSAIQTNRAIQMAFLLLGAFDAVGGPQLSSKKPSDPYKVHDGWAKNAEKEPKDRLDLGNTRWFPMGSGGYHMFPLVVRDPEKYGIAYKPEDMVVLVNFVNPIMTSRPREQVIEAWSKFGYVVTITPNLTATADLCADVVLPCGTLDKWEGPLNVGTLYYSADTIRQPLMPPLGEARSETDIFLDLAEKMGRLAGEGGFVDELNKALGIKDPNLLALDAKPTPRQILDAWSRSKHGITLDEFVAKGVVAKKLDAKKRYLSALDDPFGGVRGALYVPAFAKIRETMKAKGTSEGVWLHFAPLPTWSTPWIERSPPEYDLTLIDFKRMENKHTRTTANPLLRELMPANPLVMNRKTAQEKGLAEGDVVKVESHDPVSGQRRSIETKVALVEGIRPDTVGFTHHVGRPNEPSVDALIPYGDAFWDMGGAWQSHIKVRVTKRGDAE